MLLDQLGRKGPATIPGGPQLKIAIQGFDGLPAFPIPAIGGDFPAQMRIQFAFKGCFGEIFD